MIDKEPLGPETPEDLNSDDADEADHIPDSEVNKDQSDWPDQSDNKKEG